MMLIAIESTAIVLLGFMMFVILIFTTLSFKIVKENERVVIERLGAYYTTLEAGLHFVVPGFDRVKAVIEKTDVIHTNNQTFGTKDDKKIEFLLKVVYEIVNPKLFVYGVQDIDRALSLMKADILRPKILKIDSSEINFETETLSSELKDELTKRIDVWGLACKSVSMTKRI